MTRKKNETSKSKKSSDPDEYSRFVETARKLGADESPEAFDRAFKRVTGRTRSIPKK